MSWNKHQYLLALAALHVCLSTADADPADTAGPTAANSLEERLDRVLDQAFDGGLLQLPKPNDADASVIPESVGEEPVKSCPRPQDLDFGNYSQLTKYEDLTASFDTSTGAGGARLNREKVGSFIALGLYAEALADLKALPPEESSYYLEIATLMSGWQNGGVNLERISSCDGPGALWGAIDRLRRNDPAAVDILQSELNAYRDLPINLRADVAAMIVPKLIVLNEPVLVEMVLANFSLEEMESHSPLKFVSAAIGVGTRRDGADQALRNYLQNPYYRDDALSVLAAQQKIASGDEHDALIDKIIRDTDPTAGDDSLSERVIFAFEELGVQPSYSKITELASTDSFAASSTRNALKSHALDRLGNDLRGTDFSTRLTALDSLMSLESLINDHDGFASLITLATDVAVNIGLHDLAVVLLDKTDGFQDYPRAAELAGMIYVNGGCSTINRISEENGLHAGLAFHAARCAIRTNNAQLFERYSTDISFDDAQLVGLIEQDALSQSQMLTPIYFDAVGGIEDPTLRRRADLVNTLRKARQGSDVAKQRVEIAEVETILFSKSVPASSAKEAF